MSKFTQGKWVTCVDGSVDILDGKGRVIGTFCDIVGAHEEAEMMDNARLIAAAPEMYKLLRNLSFRTSGMEQHEVLKIRELLARIDGKEGRQ